MDRGKLLGLLKNIIKPNDLRIIYTLLNGTGINVRFGSITARVNTEIGSSQGDGLSGILGSGSQKSSISTQKRNHT